MTVHTEASGRRFVQIEIDVPGTPEDVWHAIATGPGITSWFMPAEFEEHDGKPVALKLYFGPGVEARSQVTTWDQPRMFATKADGWMPDSPPIASEWTIEARDGGMCTLRIVQSLFASTGDWDNQLESAESGLYAFLRTLQIYLAHFRGQHATLLQLSTPTSGTDAETWATLTAALGLTGVAVGQSWSAPSGAPSLSGVVEYLADNPYDALLRLDKPGPGVGAFGAVTYPGGHSVVAMNLYLYGDPAHQTVVRETPVWQAWFEQRFPTPTESSVSE